MENFDYQALVNEIINRNINMFETFEDWTKGAFALSNLGEEGRGLFKSISKLSSKYNEAENNRKFANALHTSNNVSIATFIYMCHQHGIDTNKYYVKGHMNTAPTLPAKVVPRLKNQSFLAINSSYVSQSSDRHFQSDFTRYLRTIVSDFAQLSDVVNAYHLGVTKEHHVIYWYVDIDGIVRMGKVMAYCPNGHRNHAITPSSIAKELSKRGEIPADYVIKKTLFGEHLLRDSHSSDKTIGIVESEKTSIICSLFLPNLLWLATGSFGNLQEERMSAVKNCDVILFPDTDKDGYAYGMWSGRAEELNEKGWHIRVSDYLEKTATPEQRLAKVDIADLLIGNINKSSGM